jgi:hypothetical protein
MNRFHRKWHRHNHHTYATNGEIDSSHDPIASPEDPFKGDFILNGALSASAPLSAYAGKFHTEADGSQTLIINTDGVDSIGLNSTSTGIGISTSGANIGIITYSLSGDNGDINIDEWGNSNVQYPNFTNGYLALKSNGNAVVTNALSAGSIWTDALYATSAVLVVTDMHLQELSGFIVKGSDYNPNVPTNLNPQLQQVVFMNGIGVSGTSWLAMEGDIQTHRNLIVDNNSYLSGNVYIGGGLDLGCGEITNVAMISTTCTPTISVYNNLDMAGYSISGIGNESISFVDGTKFSTDGSSGLTIDAYNIRTNTTVIASGQYSYAEGLYTSASGDGSHAEGWNTLANAYAHAEGIGSNAIGGASHAEGNNTFANGTNSHAEGQLTFANGQTSHSEGFATYSNGDFSHVEGYRNIADDDYAHAEGAYTLANFAAHSEGYQTSAVGFASHSGGWQTRALGAGSHAHGLNQSVSAELIAQGEGSFAGGKIDSTSTDSIIASGIGSFAFGSAVSAIGDYSIALGRNSRAIHSGSYVWNGHDTETYSTNTDQYTVSAEHGVVLGSFVNIPGSLSAISIHTDNLYVKNSTKNLIVNLDPRVTYSSQGSALHFTLDVSTVNNFSNIEISANSLLDQTNWEYWNGVSFQDLTSGGLIAAYQDEVYGNVTYTCPVTSDVMYYVRYRSWDGFAYSNYKVEKRTV